VSLLGCQIVKQSPGAICAKDPLCENEKVLRGDRTLGQVRYRPALRAEYIDKEHTLQPFK